MSGDDIVDELQFRVTVTRVGGQHNVREVMSDIMAMENARSEIKRLRTAVEECRGIAFDRAADEAADKVERLQAAGDALAEVVCFWHEERIPVEFLDPLTAWQEARRER